MAKIKVDFRDTIPWDGLEWGESLRLPERLLRFLADEDFTDQERLVVLRLYSLLQDGQETPDAIRLARWGEDRPNSKLVEWLNPDAPLRESLRPIYSRLYPEIGKAGYSLFINGDLFSFVYPRQILPIIKLIPTTTPDGKSRDVTSHFIFTFILQLVAVRNQQIIRDDWYVGGRQLNLSVEHLIFAIGKVVFGRSDEFGVYVTDRAMIEDFLTADILVAEGEEDIYDQATRLFYTLRYGEENAERLEEPTLLRYRQEWIRLCKEGNLDMETVIRYLPAVFEGRDPKKVPTPYARFDDPASNLWGRILAERAKGRKNSKSSRRGMARI